LYILQNTKSILIFFVHSSDNRDIRVAS